MKSTYVHIEKIIGMSTYDNNAHLIGKVQEIGLRKLLDGYVEFSFKIKNSNNEIKEIEWNKISKIGDIIILADQNLRLMRINQEVLEVFITLVVVIVIRTSIVLHLIIINTNSKIR